MQKRLTTGVMQDEGCERAERCVSMQGGSTLRLRRALIRATGRRHCQPLQPIPWTEFRPEAVYRSCLVRKRSIFKTLIAAKCSKGIGSDPSWLPDGVRDVSGHARHSPPPAPQNGSRDPCGARHGLRQAAASPEGVRWLLHGARRRGSRKGRFEGNGLPIFGVAS